MKLCLGVGPLPIHRQHLEILGDVSEWTLVDLYVKDPQIKNWDATKLDEVEDNSIEYIYASHLLEHIPHIQVKDVLKLWYSKLKEGGQLYINVPDLEWAADQLLLLRDNNLNGYYHRFDTEHGLLSIFYGSQSHDGEYHKSGFTNKYLRELLKEIGFSEVRVKPDFDAHSMGVLIATGVK